MCSSSNALVTAWGAEVDPEHGKTVWFELDTTTAIVEAHGDEPD